MSKAREYRQASGLTQKEVGQKVNRSIGSISLYESGQRSLPVPLAKKLARLYGCKWSEFYEDEKDGKAVVS